MVKLSILAFYYRIFVIPLFRKLVLATAAFVVAWGIGITITLILACRPIEAFWNSNIKGVCLELVTFTYVGFPSEEYSARRSNTALVHQHFQLDHRYLDLCFALASYLALAHANQEEGAPLLHLLHRSSVSTHIAYVIVARDLPSLTHCSCRTCIISSVRLTVVLGHGYPDFTWSYVPLGAYSAFEPLGGLLCANLPIIFHLWRRRRQILSDSMYIKKLSMSLESPGSGPSRRSRMARSLGLSNASSGVDSQARTIVGDEENGWNDEMQEHTAAQNDRSQFFGKVERVHEVVGEADGSNSPSSADGITPPPPVMHVEGMKRNVWEVRRKN